jgi:hypothetical protein
MGTVEDIDRMIAGLNQEIARLTNMTPPKDAGFLISANGILRGLRDDWEHGCSEEHVDEQMAKLREIVDGKWAELGESDDISPPTVSGSSCRRAVA